MKPLVPILAALLCCRAIGEVVYLTDGTSVEGDLRRTSDGWVVTAADGKTTTVPADRVKSIQIKKATGGPDTSGANLASLRRAVGNLTDIRQILERYKTFLSQNQGTPAAAEAQQDVAQWQQRLDQGLLKSGDEWVTPERFAELREKARAAARQIEPLLDAGKLNDAAALLDRLLATVPPDATLLYLKGLILFRQEQLVPARKAFESVEALLPDHAPTHNNLAVILWRTRSQMPALLQYDKAMLASPGTAQVLDNVAEALNALPAENRKSALTKKVVAHFQEQDAALQKKMAERGLYRWGSTWLNEQEFAKIQAAEKAVQDKIDTIQKSIDVVTDRILAIDRNILQEQSLMDTMQQESNRIDPRTGNISVFPLPQRYWDLKRDVDNLKTERAQKVKEGQRLLRDQDEQKKKLPVPKYTGIQKLIEVDGVPGGSAAQPPTTAPPTTAPAAPAPAATQSAGDFR